MDNRGNETAQLNITSQTYDTFQPAPHNPNQTTELPPIDLRNPQRVISFTVNANNDILHKRRYTVDSLAVNTSKSFGSGVEESENFSESVNDAEYSETDLYAAINFQTDYANTKTPTTFDPQHQHISASTYHPRFSNSASSTTPYSQKSLPARRQSYYDPHHHRKHHQHSSHHSSISPTPIQANFLSTTSEKFPEKQLDSQISRNKSLPNFSSSSSLQIDFPESGLSPSTYPTLETKLSQHTTPDEIQLPPAEPTNYQSSIPTSNFDEESIPLFPEKKFSPIMYDTFTDTDFNNPVVSNGKVEPPSGHNFSPIEDDYETHSFKGFHHDDDDDESSDDEFDAIQQIPVELNYEMIAEYLSKSVPRPVSSMTSGSTRKSSHTTITVAQNSLEMEIKSRVKFYSEKTGLLSAENFEQLDFSSCLRRKGKGNNNSNSTSARQSREFNHQREFFGGGSAGRMGDGKVELNRNGKVYLGPAVEQIFQQVNIPESVGDEDEVEYSDKIVKLLKSGPFWIDICTPTSAEMQLFSKLFGIHPLTAEDILTEETREKCENFANYYFICIRTFDQDTQSPTYMAPINVYMVIFRECILSFHMRPVPHFANVLKRIGQLRVYGLKITPDWVSYAIIDDLVDGFVPVLTFIDMEVQSVDELVLILKETESADMLRRIGYVRKQVLSLIRLIATKPDLIKHILKRCLKHMAPGSDTVLYISDIQDHVISMSHNLTFYEKTLARSHSNYLAQISIEITQTSNRTNDVVAKMTALASILVPLNIITGMWGMNVEVPGQDVPGLHWFFGIVSVMMFIAITTYWVVKKYALS
ncbi:CorA metal ion transporter [Nowakowskiella sp. JEL0407]|nr:CorA metal ion transporter [Nowakowskiella sp. JEL0407]